MSRDMVDLAPAESMMIVGRLKLLLGYVLARRSIKYVSLPCCCSLTFRSLE